MENRAETLAAIVRLAEEAGALILEIYNTDFDVEKKGDGSPVTVADERAEAHIMAGLRAMTPDIPAVGEEESSQGITAEVGSARSGWSIRSTARRNSSPKGTSSPSISA